MEYLSNALTRMFCLLQIKADPKMVHEWGQYLIKSNLTNEEIFHACKSAIDDGELNPYKLTVGKFIEYAKPKFSFHEKSLLEWDKVLSFVRLGGSRKPMPDNFDAVTKKTIETIGGLETIGESTAINLGFIKNSFREAFAAHCKAIEINNAKYLFGAEEKPQIEEAE